MLKIQETWVNKTEGYSYGKSDWYEPFTDDLGELFKSLQREYGRCISKVYNDNIDGTSYPIGWVFEKRANYDDTNETYLQNTWVCHKQTIN